MHCSFPDVFQIRVILSCDNRAIPDYFRHIYIRRKLCIRQEVVLCLHLYGPKDLALSLSLKPFERATKDSAR